MTVAVRLYAGVRERAGKARLEVDGRTIAAVRAAVAAACPAIAGQLASCRFAVNDEFVGDDAAVPSGAVVDVIPPVSGG
ncbi:MAG TPA: MoaD/ThiS family protein [Planctomycetota bacterium]|nr:MoaD/ThiS family protein [Planctomycetota bacterium]